MKNRKSILYLKKFSCLLSCIVLLQFHTGKAFAQDLPRTISTLPAQTDHSAAKTALSRLMLKGGVWLSSRPDSALQVYQEALQISKEINDAEATADAFYYMAKAHEGKQAYGEAIRYIKEAIAIDQNILNKNPVGRYAVLSQLYLQTGAYDSIIALGSREYAAVNASDSFFRATIYIYAGKAYTEGAKMDSALQLYHKALNNWPETDTGNAYFLCMAYIGLAQISYNLRDPDKALAYIDKGLKIAKVFQDSMAVINLLSTKSLVYDELNDFKKAREFAEEGMLYFQKNKQQEEIALSAYNIAGLYIKEGNLEKGLAYAQISYDAAGQTKTFWTRVLANYIMGYAHVKLERYQEAEKYLLPAIEEAQQNNYINNVTDAFSMLSVAYAGMGDWQKAYEYRYKFSNDRDSLRGTEVAARIAHVEMKYETAQKDQQLAEQKALILQKESKLREKNFWIGGIAGGAILLSALFLSVYRSRQFKLRANMLELQKNQELSLLKARMQAEQQERSRIGRELHDGIVSDLLAIRLDVNLLQSDRKKSIDDFALSRIAQQLEVAASDLRTTAHNLIPDIILQRGLEHAIALLCEKNARQSNLEVSYQVYGDIPQMQQEVALSIYRMVQELIQNVLKHANASQLLVQLSHNGGLFSITVEDNGIGFPPDVGLKSSGIGLANIRERVVELNGTMDINCRPGVETTVYLEFNSRYLI